MSRFDIDLEKMKDDIEIRECFMDISIYEFVTTVIKPFRRNMNLSDISQLTVQMEKFGQQLGEMNNHNRTLHEETRNSTRNSMSTAIGTIPNLPILAAMSENVNRFVGNSAQKGKHSEQVLVDILSENIPYGEFEPCGTQNHTGDIMFRRDHYPDILIENKEYSRPIPKKEIDKFQRDCREQDVSGILCSRKTKIARKDSFAIEKFKGNYLIYLSNHDNDANKFDICIRFIDYLNSLETPHDIHDNISISNEKFEILSTGIKNFKNLLQKQSDDLIQDLESMKRKIKKNLEEYSFCEIERVLSEI